MTINVLSLNVHLTTPNIGTIFIPFTILKKKKRKTATQMIEILFNYYGTFILIV